MKAESKTLIIGAGPAGMGCAYALAEAGVIPLVADKERVGGGLCRTLDFKDFRFDIGGHRFFSASPEVNRLWKDILGADLLRVRRLSRIYYRDKYFDYPLSFANTFKNLGWAESLCCATNYLQSRFLRPADDNTFAGWTVNRFGSRLFNIFFKDFTEKIWGLPCEDISSEWARQRMQGLSLRVAVQKALSGNKNSGPKTLCAEFFYPRFGPGQFYRRLEAAIGRRGGKFSFSKKVTSVWHEGNKIVSINLYDGNESKEENFEVNYLFSSMPLSFLVKSFKPLPPAEVVSAAENLRFRSFLTVNAIFDKERIFPDQWIYVNSPRVRLGRIQNYKNWSLGMSADFKKTSLGLEYFCSQGDSVWAMNDKELIAYALGELESLGIVSGKYFRDGFVSRHADTYPVYLRGYQKNVEVIRKYLAKFSNLQTIGRAGLFRYDNSDHALLTGIHAARNFLGQSSSDIWKI